MKKKMSVLFGIFVVLALSVSVFTSCLSLDSLFEEDGLKTAEEYRARGGTYLDKEDYDHALADFNKAIQLDPKLARAYYNRGQVYYYAPTTRIDAIRRMEEDLAEAGSGAQLKRHEIVTRDVNKAMKEFEKALEIDPNFIRAGYANAYIGDYYLEMGDDANARLYANKALKIEKDNSLALDVLAHIFEPTPQPYHHFDGSPINLNDPAWAQVEVETVTSAYTGKKHKVLRIDVVTDRYDRYRVEATGNPLTRGPDKLVATYYVNSNHTVKGSNDPKEIAIDRAEFLGDAAGESAWDSWTSPKDLQLPTTENRQKMIGGYLFQNIEGYVSSDALQRWKCRVYIVVD